MPEDVYDFEGQNPGELLTVDEHAQPFDYATRLREKGHTRNSPPDTERLFKILATDYVPSRVVDLPPRVVTKVKVVRHPRTVIRWTLLVAIYLAIVGLAYVFLPYQDLTDFRRKTQMEPGGRCTITSAQISSYTVDGDSASVTYYKPTIGFILHTPGGRNYHTSEYDAPSFTSSDDAQAYLSQHQVKHVYPCWYNPADPTVARFVRDLGFGDYAGLFGWFCFFLLGGVLPNALIVRTLWQDSMRRRRERRASRAASIVS